MTQSIIKQIIIVFYAGTNLVCVVGISIKVSL